MGKNNADFVPNRDIQHNLPKPPEPVKPPEEVVVLDVKVVEKPKAKKVKSKAKKSGRL